jgi:flavin reductase like protein
MTQFRAVALEHASRLINHGPTVLVTSIDGARRNIMAAAWSMPVEFTPPRIAMVIDKNTFTRELVMASGNLRHLYTGRGCGRCDVCGGFVERARYRQVCRVRHRFSRGACAGAAARRDELRGVARMQADSRASYRRRLRHLFRRSGVRGCRSACIQQRALGLRCVERVAAYASSSRRRKFCARVGHAARKAAAISFLSGHIHKRRIVIN